MKKSLFAVLAALVCFVGFVAAEDQAPDAGIPSACKCEKKCECNPCECEDCKCAEDCRCEKCKCEKKCDCNPCECEDCKCAEKCKCEKE